MPSKWNDRYTELVTAVARNMGPFGIDWGVVGEEMGESGKSCESAFWRLKNKRKGQPAMDARLLQRKMKTNDSYAKIVADFPGYTIADLKSRMAVLAGEADNRWVDGLRIGFFDVEASNLKANVGFMLSWAILDNEGNMASDIVTPEECRDWDQLDYRISSTLAEELPNYDMVVGWYSTRYDVPTIRTRFEWWGIENPLEHGDLYHYDMYYTARSKLNLHSNRLEAVANFYGIEMEYKNFDLYLWKRAAMGYQSDLKYILEHNIEDVEVTAQIYEKLKRFKKLTRKSV